MPKATFPFKLRNKLNSQFLRMQAQMAEEHGYSPSLADLDRDCALYCGVDPHSIASIRRETQGASLVLALLIARYVDSPLSEVFHIVADTDEVEDRIRNWKRCGLE